MSDQESANNSATRLNEKKFLTILLVLLCRLLHPLSYKHKYLMLWIPERVQENSVQSSSFL